ncbi:MAG TPA: hypothetical protein VJ124_03975 [Pyrinomonadaceae bacterium]|nr:hypothetical protein [Pyrinomonadaceae bacterium]
MDGRSRVRIRDPHARERAAAYSGVAERREVDAWSIFIAITGSVFYLSANVCSVSTTGTNSRFNGLRSNLNEVILKRFEEPDENPGVRARQGYTK